MNIGKTKEKKGSFIKNMTVSKKLSFGFGIILVLLVLSAVLSLYNINNISQQIGLYGKYTVPNSENIRSMQVSMQQTLHDLLEAIITDDAQSSKISLEKAGNYGSIIVSELEAYKNNQRNNDRDLDIDKLKTIINEAAAERAEISELVLNRSDANLKRALNLYENEYKPRIDKAMEILLGFSTNAKENAAQQSEDADASSAFAWVMLIVCITVSVFITIIVVLAIRKSILPPVNEIVSTYREISKGNMRAEIKYESRDELGQMAKLIQDTNELQSTILGDVIEKFTKISNGDLRIQVDLVYPGDFAVLKKTIENTVSTLNNTMQIINSAAEQVSVGAAQVSGGAQELAAGSTEQASSVQELNASVTQIAEQAAKNSSNVKFASRYIDEAGAGVNAGNEHMKQLTGAMEKIGSASNQIANITKVIEDIAFQTNILALNAAIEAARAGTAGKGFAVVADEVRNLAAKSAEAAKQTSDLIHNSVDTVSKGTQIALQTAQVLQDVGKSALKVTESFAKIEQASYEQTKAIEQIKQGIDQVSDVVQTNAATAEENSATSEEMSAQAVALREEVSKFKLYEETAQADI